jgi:hypothetical protein
MDGMMRFPRRAAGRAAVSPRLGGAPVTSTDTGYPWADGDILYAADLNAAFDRVGENVSQDVGRNLLHNPLFNVAQRGAGPFATAFTYTLDRWFLALGSDTSTVQQATLADPNRTSIGDETASHSLYVNVVGTSGGGNGATYVSQRIEDVRRLAGKTVTVSFYVNNTVGAQRIGVNFAQQFGTGGSPSAAVVTTGQSAVCAAANVFSRVSLTFVIPSIIGMTLGTNNDSNTEIRLWFSAGANNAAPSGGVGVQTGIFNIWGIQLEIGSVATPLEKPDPQQDLAKCQRFYCVNGSIGLFGWSGAAAQGIATMITYPVTMRAAVTPVLGFNTNTNFASVAPQSTTSAGFQLVGSTAGVGACAWNGTFTASADL